MAKQQQQQPRRGTPQEQIEQLARLERKLERLIADRSGRAGS